MWGEPWGSFSMTLDRTPHRVDTTADFVDVACGAFHNLALNAQGEVFSWGIGDFGQVRVCACVCVWGASSRGSDACWAPTRTHMRTHAPAPPGCAPPPAQLGNGTTGYATQPERVVGLEGVFVADVAAGGWHSMAITSDGEVYMWGRGEYGRLGLGDRSGSSKLRPQKVSGAGGCAPSQPGVTLHCCLRRGCGSLCLPAPVPAR